MHDRRDVIRMVANFVLFLLALLLLSVFVGCRATRTIATEVRDSVRYETRYRHEVIFDTINVEIPHLSDVAITPDSFSHLENELAVSEAEVRGGYLRHTLETKPHVRRAQVVREVITKDSIVYKDRAVEVERVTEKRLPFWQRLLLYMAPGLAALSIGLLIYIKVKR